jgi:hypothetical protein
VRRTLDGAVSTHIAGTPVRVFAWVDLDPPDPFLDPAIVGGVVAAGISSSYRRSGSSPACRRSTSVAKRDERGSTERFTGGCLCGSVRIVARRSGSPFDAREKWTTYARQEWPR